MKTLHEERKRLLVHHPTLSEMQAICMSGRQHTFESDGFFREYGDWRVVEGVLVGKKYGDGVWVNDQRNDGVVVPRRVGEVGQRVKLILPPEEKVECDEWIRRSAYDEICKAMAHKHARADRYEKALREIATREWKAQDSRPDTAAWVMGWEFAARIAEGALDDE